MRKQLVELLQQMHETEMGGIKIYETALQCVVDKDLKKEWTEYLEQTRRHEKVVRELMSKLGVPDADTPGRAVVKHIGGSLVAAMQMAMPAGGEAAQLVACECVVLAETKDHLNWELLGKVGEEAKGREREAIIAACEEVEEEEDEHIYHSKGWTRELWIDSLGMKAVLPPPEEQKDVKTAIGAERAKQSRERLM